MKLIANQDFKGSPNGRDVKDFEKGDKFEAEDDFGKMLLASGLCDEDKEDEEEAKKPEAKKPEAKKPEAKKPQGKKK